MKKIVICLSFLLHILQVAGQPCPTDSLKIGGSPSFATDTETPSYPPLPCYNYGCEADFCHSWELPPNFVGHLELWSNTSFTFPVNVQIWQDCHLVRFSECVTIASPSIEGWDTLLVFPPRAQLVVCNSINPITVTIKPVAAHDTLPDPFLDVDTLCGGLSPILAPIKSESYMYYELPIHVNSKKVRADERKPLPSMYKPVKEYYF